ncbi:hypothetical protein LZ31DRAFT_88915 [Colletotrichum somersetense]|nr:hypothetical protein LZ31DRAFT_88915 [Colletotrichum somersetense]
MMRISQDNPRIASRPLNPCGNGRSGQAAEKKIVVRILAGASCRVSRSNTARPKSKAREQQASEAEGSLCLGMGGSVSHGITGVFLENRAGALSSLSIQCDGMSSGLPPVDPRSHGLRESRAPERAAGRCVCRPLSRDDRMGVRRQGETARLRRAQRSVGNMAILSVQCLATAARVDKILAGKGCTSLNAGAGGTSEQSLGTGGSDEVDWMAPSVPTSLIGDDAGMHACTLFSR